MKDADGRVQSIDFFANINPDFVTFFQELKDDKFNPVRLLVLGDTETRLLAVWTHVNCRVIDNLGEAKIDSKEDVWKAIYVDTYQWARLAGVASGGSDGTVVAAMDRVRHLGMVYPDGGMPDDVNGYLKIKAASSIKR